MMARRTYNQYCPIAYSLDHLGERWTLLLVRELAYGPRRFADLNRSLPGVGKNLLSQRLRSLEQLQVIRRRTLPPPAPVTVYELTAQGEGLRSILDDLTRWGLPFLPQAPSESDTLSVASTMNALNALFDPQAAAYIALACECRVEGEIFSLQIRRGGMTLSQGPALAPDLTLQAEATSLLLLVMGRLDPTEALQDGRVEILAGNRSLLSEFIGLFRAPESR